MAPPIALGDLSKPRILCLHGGGSCAAVFDLQTRGITNRLKEEFRFVFPQAPFECRADDGIAQFYGELGPFARWLGWRPAEHPVIDGTVAANLIKETLTQGMAADPGTGDWVGVMGFSQGTKIGASLLWAQEKLGPEKAGTAFRFAVLMNGMAPFIMLDWDFVCPKECEADPGALTGWFTDFPAEPASEGDHILSIPTYHIIGKHDPAYVSMKASKNKYCKPGTARLYEWDGGHRIPVKIPDVTKIVSEIKTMARETGAIV